MENNLNIEFMMKKLLENNGFREFLCEKIDEKLKIEGVGDHVINYTARAFANRSRTLRHPMAQIHRQNNESCRRPNSKENGKIYPRVCHSQSNGVIIDAEIVD
jgi:hypothetical protein